MIGAIKNHSITIALTVAILSALIVLLVFRSQSPTNLTLDFKAVVGDSPLAFNQMKYANPGGDGIFKIRDFQFYISNIKLTGESTEYTEPESYHLVRFDGENNRHAIVLDNIPDQSYQKISFSIGVDSAANKSITPIGDLDPNSRMAWSWDTGYKFVLLEGRLDINNALVPLVYHIGFDENCKPVSIDLAKADFEGPEPSISFQVDIMKLFTGKSVIDIAALPSVKFDHGDAKQIADNYQQMISLQP